MKKSGFIFFFLISFTHLFSQTLFPLKDTITNLFGYRNEYNTKWSLKPAFISAEDFYNNVAIISTKDGYGLINNNGAFIIEPQLEELSGEQYFIFKKNKEKGILNTQGKILVSGEYDHIYYEPARGDAILMKDQLYGYWDTTGNLIPPISKYELGFNNDVGYFNSGKTQGFLNKKGVKIIEVEEGDLWDIMPFGFISKKGKKDCLFDMSGKMIGQCDFDTIIQLRKDFILFYKNDKYGIINYQGEPLLSGEYQYISPFNEQGIAVVKKSELYGLINEKFEVVMPIDNKKIEDFGNDYNRFYGKYKNPYKFSIYKKNEHFGVINDSGRVVMEPQYDMAMIDGNFLLKFIYKDKLGMHDLRTLEKLPLTNSFDFINDKTIFCIKTNNGTKCGIARKDGRIIVMPIYLSITRIVNGYAIVRTREGMSIIDSSGQLIVPLVYSDIKSLDDIYKNYFHHTGDYVWDGFLYVKTKNNQVGVAEENGKLIIDTSYASVTVFDAECNCWFVKTAKGPWNIISQTGKKYSVRLDTSSSYMLPGLAIAKKDGLCGLINLKGKTIFPFKNKKIIPQVNGLFYYKIDSLWGVVDYKGKIISQPLYKSISSYTDGFAFAKSSIGWGLVDTLGKFNAGYEMLSQMKKRFVKNFNSSEVLEISFSNNLKEFDELSFEILDNHSNKVMLKEVNDLILETLKANISNHVYSSVEIMYPENAKKYSSSESFSAKGIEIINVTKNTVTINNFLEESGSGMSSISDDYDVLFFTNGVLNKTSIKDLIKEEADTIKLKELIFNKLKQLSGKEFELAEINLNNNLNFQVSDTGLIFRLGDLITKKSEKIKESDILLTYEEIKSFVKSDGALKEFY